MIKTEFLNLRVTMEYLVGYKTKQAVAYTFVSNSYPPNHQPHMNQFIAKAAFLLVYSILCTGTCTLYGQSVVLSGNVSDKATSEPLSSVTITIKENLQAQLLIREETLPSPPILYHPLHWLYQL
jgi:hypothetical protein